MITNHLERLDVDKGCEYERADVVMGSLDVMLVRLIIIEAGGVAAVWSVLFLATAPRNAR